MAQRVFARLQRAGARLPMDYVRLLAERETFPRESYLHELADLLEEQDEWHIVGRDGAVNITLGGVSDGDDDVDDGKDREEDDDTVLVHAAAGGDAGGCVNLPRSRRRKVFLGDEVGECSYTTRRWVDWLNGAYTGLDRDGAGEEGEMALTGLTSASRRDRSG
jgi:hypothetical protein